MTSDAADQDSSESTIGKLLVGWKIEAASWQVIEDRMKVLQSVLPKLSLSWAKQAGLPSAIPSVKGWFPRLRHRGIGPVGCSGKLIPGDPIEGLLLIAALRCETVVVSFVDDLGNQVEKFDEFPSILSGFGVTADEVGELGGEDLGLVTKIIRFKTTSDAPTLIW